MAAKKARSSSEKKMKATIHKLEAKLEREEAKAARWKERTKQTQAEVVALNARAAKLDRKLATTRDAAPQPAPVLEEPVTPLALRTPASSLPTERTPSTPDANWTVAQLRAEARSRGLTGLSAKSKAQLIAALS